MTRKKIADSPAQPISDAAAGKSANASKKARAPRASSTAVTHKHKAAFPAAPEAAAEQPAVKDPTAATASLRLPSHDEIAVRAYLISESRGFQGGSPVEDWLYAERELTAERQA